jgi:hypothetical protein
MSSCVLRLELLKQSRPEGIRGAHSQHQSLTTPGGTLLEVNHHFITRRAAQPDAHHYAVEI